MYNSVQKNTFNRSKFIFIVVNIGLTNRRYLYTKYFPRVKKNKEIMMMSTKNSITLSVKESASVHLVQAGDFPVRDRNRACIDTATKYPTYKDLCHFVTFAKFVLERSIKI